MAGRRLRRGSRGARPRPALADRLDQRAPLLRPHDAARDPDPGGRAAARPRPSPGAAPLGPAAASSPAGRTVVPESLVEGGMARRDRTSLRLGDPRPRSLDLA